MNNRPVDRRKLLKQLTLGGTAAAIALEQLAAVPLFGTWASDFLANPLNPYDSYALMADAFRGGKTMLGVHQAMAQTGTSPWTLVHIKVCNHLSTPMVFKLGEADANGVVTVDSGTRTPTGTMTAGKAAMEAQGMNLLSDLPRYRALRFNKWFANMLHNGTADGVAPGSGASTNLIGLASNDVAPLGSGVAVQAFLGLKQIDSNNHALKGLKVRATLPDLTLFAQQKGLIQSPLGISCFMMGGLYDKAEGATPANAVLGEGAGESVVVTSRTVGAYVAQIRQFVGNSYADRASIEQNVIYRMDHLVQEDPVLRRDLVNSIVQFQAGLGPLTSCANLEFARQTKNPATVNIQSNGGTVEQGATTEFLAQCKYVTASLDLPGTPVKNFSLFLNIADLDGTPFDKVVSNGGAAAKALSYVEGMRQLAMGLNMLGKKIDAGARMIVLVSTEGGRGIDGADNKTSFALVMGPRIAGGLDDALYANMADINKRNGPMIVDAADNVAARPWDVDGLKTSAGANAPATMVPTTGDVQMGVVEFLEDQTGKAARDGLSSSDGAYVKLKRLA